MRYLFLGSFLVLAAQSRSAVADVRQSIGMVSVGSPFELPAKEWPAVTSPDGRNDAFVLYSGDVAKDTNRYRIVIADRKARTGAALRTVYTLVTHNDGTTAGISELRWSDSDYLTALIVGDGGVTQLVRLDTRTGCPTVVTGEHEDVVDYASNRSGGVIALIRSNGAVEAKGEPSAYSGTVVGSEEPYVLMGDRAAAFSRTGFDSNDDVVLRAAGHDTIIKLPHGEWPMADEGLSVSPSGRYVIIPVGMFRPNVPRSWIDPTMPADWVFFYGMRLYDGHTKTLRWLVAGPTYWKRSIAPVWSNDETAVFISSQFLRKPGGNPAPGAAVIAVDNGKILASLQGAFELGSGGGELKGLRIVESNLPSYQVRVVHGGLSWRFEPVAARGEAIRLRQNMDHPPMLVWHNFAAGREQLLLNLNPGLRTGNVQVRQFRWILKDGSVATAGLYLPRDVQPGERLPLIIQTHGWDQSQFWYDGPSTAGFAARSLVENGFAVVQIGFLPRPVAPLADESASVDMIDRLIDALDATGTIDPGRLGITAWSATGFAVRSALVFSRHHFSAAILVDSRDIGFFNYLLMDSGRQDLFDSEMGGMPFGKGLDAWRANSPMFNMDRITTPVRLVSLGPRILAQWEQWASMKRLGKPIDFIWLPQANHWPTRPSERMEVQQGAVDWYRFWLLGKAPTDAAQVAEFTRWGSLAKEANEEAIGSPPTGSPSHPDASPAQ